MPISIVRDLHPAPPPLGNLSSLIDKDKERKVTVEGARWVCDKYPVGFDGVLSSTDLHVLLAALDLYPGDAVVQHRGCNAVTTLCCVAENRFNLVRMLTADRMFTALRQHDKDRDVQVGGDGCMANPYSLALTHTRTRCTA